MATVEIKGPNRASVKAGSRSLLGLEQLTQGIAPVLVRDSAPSNPGRRALRWVRGRGFVAHLPAVDCDRHQQCSMLRLGMLPVTGQRKIGSSVFRCHM